MRIKFSLLILIFFLCSLTLSGCKQIFIEEKNPYEQVKLSKDELNTNVFYVKDGTKFIKVWNTNKYTTGYNTYLGTNGGHVVCLGEDYRAVPTLYKNEILAIASTNTEVGSFQLTRYKELGYSIGIFGMNMDKDNYLYANLNSNIYPNGILYSYLKQNAKSDQYRLISINGEPVSDSMISPVSGSFNCMQKGMSYQINYYAGTFYSSMEVLADTLILEQFESFSLKNGEDTKNGYISFEMPEGAKSGWYSIEGYGLFRYIDANKGVSLENINMNEPFYASEQEKISVYSQKFSISLDTRKTNITLSFTYDKKDDIAAEQIQGRAYSPDGTEYILRIDEENNQLLCELKEAMAGKWEIYIHPKELNILSMDVINAQVEQEISEEEFPLIIDTEKTNLQINISYEGDGEIYAILITPDNKRYDFTTYHKNKVMTYLAPFLSQGIYTIKVYHYTDTNILEIDTQENSKTISDIITVTE